MTVDKPMRSTTLVWIDARKATIVRWRNDLATFERIESEVPAHHRATGHVRYQPGIRHGGGSGRPQTAGEPHRLEHLNQFVAQVAGRLADQEDLLILGPGTVRERLERRVRAQDARNRRTRSVSCEASPHLTDPQLVVRLRHHLGLDPVRGRAGAYRWSEASPLRPSGEAVPPPRRVVAKPARRPESSQA